MAAAGLGTDKKGLRWEEDQEEEKTRAGRKAGVLEVGRRLEQWGAGQGRRQAGWWVEAPRRKEAGMEGRTAAAGTPGEREPGRVEAPDPSRRMEVKFAAMEAAVQKKR